MTHLAVQVSHDEHVFLVGRPPIGELIGFIRTMAVNGQAADQGELAQQWRAANDHVLELERTEAGIADNPPLADLPAELSPMATEVLTSPIFQRAFRLLPTTLRLVELDKLVVFQKSINLAYVQQLKVSIGPKPTPKAVMTLALNVSPQHQPVRVMQNAQTSFTFICPTNDFRFLEAQFVDPNNVQGFVSTGFPTSILGLAVGFGSNLLNVVHAENRLVLNNGSHRAYALRDLGVTHVPCLVQEVSRRDELDLVGGDLQASPDRYFRAPRPPLLKDYFDERLRMVVPVYRKNRVVRLQFAFEQSDIPA
jgi:hypothetical protein